MPEVRPGGVTACTRHPWRVLEWLMLLSAVLRVACRSHRAVAVEHLLLRQPLTVALRARPRPPLSRHDRLFWLAARRRCADWRRLAPARTRPTRGRGRDSGSAPPGEPYSRTPQPDPGGVPARVVLRAR